jgi:hypothetical protein
MKAILPLPSKTRKAIEEEVIRQTGENVRKLSLNIQALVLWYLRQKYRFGKKRLLAFQKDFLPLIQELQNYYQLENARETEFVCLKKLREDVGIDVEQLNEMFAFQVKMTERRE